MAYVIIEFLLQDSVLLLLEFKLLGKSVIEILTGVSVDLIKIMNLLEYDL